MAEETPIRFIGVWDTVGSLGNPLWLNSWLSRRNRFHDLNLSSSVENAFQALAIDEKRRHFKAALWNQQDGAAEKGQTLEQVWFVGVHSNVGGGYPSCGLSDISLQWMVNKAMSCGLGIDRIQMNPLANDRVEESRKGAYWLVPPWYRPIDHPGEGKITRESLHETVHQRFNACPKYRPKNLLAYFARRNGS